MATHCNHSSTTRNPRLLPALIALALASTCALTPAFCSTNSSLPAAKSPGIAKQLGAEIATAVEKVMPAVVVVRTETVLHVLAQDRFRGFLYEIPQRLAGQGSGVIFRPDGHILTCHHVIEGAEEIEVALHDGTLYKARLVGSDPEADLAVLKIQPPPGGLTAIEVADSDKVRVGEFAIAIGSPFSLDSSVTLGIVSQKGRAVGLLPHEDFIQTDASINQGNSGGPLVDVDGRLIGINDAITTAGPNSQGNVGIGFAIPSNIAIAVADAIMRDGFFKRPRIGISLATVPGEQARSLVGHESAVMVQGVIRRSPAARGGLKEGDLILKINNEPVYTAREVQRAVLRHPENDPIKITVRRAGKEIELSIAGRMTEPPLLRQR